VYIWSGKPSQILHALVFTRGGSEKKMWEYFLKAYTKGFRFLLCLVKLVIIKLVYRLVILPVMKYYIRIKQKHYELNT